MDEIDLDAQQIDRWLGLLQAGEKGDETALNQFFAEIRPYFTKIVEHLAKRRRVDSADGSAVVQKSLLSVLQHLAQRRGQSAAELKAWLRQIVTNEFRDNVRDAHRQKRDIKKQVPLPQTDSGEIPIAAAHSSPSQRAIRREEQTKFEAALSRLRADDQQVIRLHHLEGRDWPETAQIMGRNETAVQRLYYRALKRLRQAMETKP